MRHLLLLAAVCGIAAPSRAQIVVTQTPSQAQVSANLLGSGVFLNTMILGGRPEAIGLFSGPSNVGISSGVVLSTNDAVDVVGPNDLANGMQGGPAFTSAHDADIHTLLHPDSPIPMNDIYSATYVEMTFIPVFDSLVFDYVFASEEYETFVCTQFNDAFGFFLSGPGLDGPYQYNAANIATLPGSETFVSVNTVNSGLQPINANGPLLDPYSYCNSADPDWAGNTDLYITNSGPLGQQVGLPQTTEPYCCDPYYIQPNGLTVRLSASAIVVPGELYRARIVVANVRDWRYGSAVFLAAGGSPKSLPRAITTSVHENTGNLPVTALFNDGRLIVHDADAHADRFEVLDQSGRVVAAFRSTGPITTLNLPHLPSGLYIVRGMGAQPFVIKAFKG